MFYSNSFIYYPCETIHEVPSCRDHRKKFSSEQELYSYLQKLCDGSKFILFIPVFGGSQLAHVEGEIERGEVIIW